MTSNRRQLLVLGAVLAVLAAVLVVMLRGNDPAESRARPSNPGRSAAATGRGATDVTDVKLELLQADQDGLVEPERNPFRFEAKAPPPQPSAPRPAPPPAFTPPPLQVPAGPPPPPPIPLRFVGIVASRNGRAAALTDGRGNNFLAREGDIIEGRYKLVRLGSDSVELAYLDGRGRQTIRLSGQ